MTRAATATLLALATTLALPACSAGPGHTRAASALIGTGVGAVIGHNYARGGGFAGAALGLAAGTIVGDGLAEDQRRALDRSQPPPPPPPPPPAPPSMVLVPQPGVVYYEAYPAPPPAGWVVVWHPTYRRWYYAPGSGCCP